jgi:(2R)-3-sulfolactate dehydrogenase (NADP+)
MTNDTAQEQTLTLSLAAVEQLAFTALLAHRTGEAQARCVARSVVAAEADGIRSHGLLRLPTYCAHVLSGKVDGFAQPSVSRSRAAAWVADARTGFAHPAIDAGFAALVPAAKEHGIAALAVTNSYNCGVVGHHVERLALNGLVALAYVNTPAAIAAWGGSRPLFGTNPLAFAAPRTEQPPLVLDQSSSVVARGEVVLRASQGREIPEGWALDATGGPTTNPRDALAGSMLPAGGYKGAGIALMVEILAGVLSGSNLSFQASSFVDDAGGPPCTGQFFIAVDPVAFLGAHFAERLEFLLHAMRAEPSVRLPGDRRLAARTRTSTHGVEVQRALYERIVHLGGGSK